MQKLRTKASFQAPIESIQNIGPFKLGYKDDHERNMFTGDTNAVNPSYEFLIINFIFPTMTPVNWNTKFITESDLIEGVDSLS